MEIVKHGTSLRSCVCPKCGCQFNFLTKEVKQTKYTLNELDYILAEDSPEIDEILRKISFYIRCPECNYEIYTNKFGEIL